MTCGRLTRGGACSAVVFLKKLSIFRENKDDMRDAGIAGKLAALVPCKNEVRARPRGRRSMQCKS